MKIPYALTAAVATPDRHAQMAAAIARGYPRLDVAMVDDAATLHVACYGPSLKDTWRDLGRPLLSMSGATRWLADRGVVPDYHVEMDPRPHKVKFLDPPVPGVHYLMASVCHPRTWDVLQGERVTLWHAVSDHDLTLDWLRKHDPGTLMLYGGSTIGLAALHVGGLLGFRHFEIHGMDGSFEPGSSERHAGEHYGKMQPDTITWDAGGVTYRTSQIMSNAVAETLNQMQHFAIFCVFHGVGLTQALIRENNFPNACCADETEKATRLRAARAAVRVLPGATKRDAGMPLEVLLAHPPEDWAADVDASCALAETYRARARYNTGTITRQAALLLRILCEMTRPTVVVEIGTFIGTSTMAFRSEHVYTCDVDNDCLPATETRTCYPRTTSTDMLRDLVAKGVKADMVFVDGRLQGPDLPLLLELCHARTLFAFDDYTGQEKGVVNVGLVRPLFPEHRLVEPVKDWAPTITIALLVNGAMLR